MEGIGVQDTLCYGRQVGESRNESSREGCDCRMDILHKSPGKDILLEAEKEKKTECQAPSWQVYKWIFMHMFQSQNLIISHSFYPDGRAVLPVAFGSNFSLLLGM